MAADFPSASSLPSFNLLFQATDERVPDAPVVARRLATVRSALAPSAIKAAGPHKRCVTASSSIGLR